MSNGFGFGSSPASGGSSFTVEQENHGFILGMPIYFDTGVNYWRKAYAGFESDVYDTFAVCVVTQYISIDFFKAETVADITPINWANLTQTGDTLASGDALYLSQTESGKFTNVFPNSGFVQQLGFYENGNLHFYPKQVIDLDIVASPEGSVKTRVQETDDYKLISTLTGNWINIYVRIKENTAGSKVFSVDLIPLGIYQQFQLLRYETAIESKNLAIAGTTTPVLLFNKLINEGYAETFSVLGVGGNIGLHTVLDNSAFGVKTPGSANIAYNTSLLLPQVATEAMTMQVTTAGNSRAHIGINIVGLIHPLNA